MKGKAPVFVQGEPMYGDFTNVGDFLDCQTRINHAEEQFMSLPSDLRRRFHNDPAEVIEFVNDPDNLEEARELGLLPKPEVIPAEMPDVGTPVPAAPAASEHEVVPPPEAGVS